MFAPRDSPIRLSPLTFNGEGVTGYCVAAYATTATIVPKTATCAPQCVVDDYYPHEWLYLPINQGEWISEIWLRTTVRDWQSREIGFFAVSAFHDSTHSTRTLCRLTVSCFPFASLC